MSDEVFEHQELTEEEFERLQRLIPGESLSRFLSGLGKGRALMEALEEPAGQEFLGRLNRKILECENFILSNVSMDGESPELKEKKIRFKVYKEEADWILNRVRKYQSDTQNLRRLAAGENKS